MTKEFHATGRRLKRDNPFEGLPSEGLFCRLWVREQTVRSVLGLTSQRRCGELTFSAAAISVDPRCLPSYLSKRLLLAVGLL